jgi:hypothetical protein
LAIDPVKTRFMEVYKSETREILRRFRSGRLSYPECVAALDSALAALVPRLTDGQLEELRAVLAANHEEMLLQRNRSDEPPEALVTTLQ